MRYNSKSKDKLEYLLHSRSIYCDYFIEFYPHNNIENDTLM